MCIIMLFVDVDLGLTLVMHDTVQTVADAEANTFIYCCCYGYGYLLGIRLRCLFA